MKVSVGFILRVAALAIAVLLAVFQPPNTLLWTDLDLGLLALGTLV